MFRAGAFGSVIHPTGWISLEFLKGQSQTLFANGSIQNLQAGFLVLGTAEEKFTFSLEARARGVSSIELTQAWAGLFASDSFHARIGLYLVPFGKYNVTNRPFETILVGDPVHSGLLFPVSWRDLGVVIDGRSKLFSYAAYIGNGFGEGSDRKPSQQFKDNNKDKALGARLGIILGEGVEIGGSYHRSKFDTGSHRAIVLKGLDLTWSTSDWNVLAEYARSETDNPSPLGRGDAENFFVQLSINYEGLKPVVGFQKYRTNDAFGGLSGTGAIDQSPDLGKKGTRWSLGVIYMPAQSVILKAEYDLNSEPDLTVKKNLFLAQLVVRF